MTLSNHLLTGAALAKFLPLPIAIPVAFVSHFALDALPHFGFKTAADRMRHLKVFKAMILLDVLTVAIIVSWLIKEGHALWVLVGLVAYSPDLLWIYRFTVEEQFGKVPPTKGNRFIQFHKNIQKYERPWGVAVEIVYGLLAYNIVR